MTRETQQAGKTAQKHRTPVQLGVTREVYNRLRQRAAQDGLPLATWLRQLAIRELRRRPKPAI
jgi:hypothetical protein